MKKFLLLSFFAFYAVVSFGQVVDICVPTVADPVGAVPHVVNTNMSLPAFGDEGTYTTPFLTSPITGFYEFTVFADGNYDIVFEASLPSPASGDFTASYNSTGACGQTELITGDIGTGLEFSCVPLLNGTNYFVAMALEDVNGGDFTITIQQSNDVCEGADEIFDGDTGDNSCSSSSGTGLVWYMYTVTTGDDVTITLTPGTLASPAINSVWLNGCSGTGTDITGNLTCLVPGDELFIEVGDITPDYGDWIFDISEADNGVANDECLNASNMGILNCSNTFVGNGDANACPDAEATCQVGDIGVWYTFTVAPIVTTFSITGSEFEVFTGADCNNLTTLGCEGDAALINILDVTSTYWILVYNTGDATVQSDYSVPANDECSAPIELFDGTAETGSNICADSDYTYCTQLASSHQVFYSFENTNATNVDIDVIITGSGALPLTGAEVVILTDCGPPGVLFNGNNTFCDALTPFSVECIEPGETIIIVVGSVDTEEGIFDIIVNETVSVVFNDNCNNATDLGTLNACAITTFASDNTDACPEDFDIGGCGFNADPVVWFEFQTPAGTESVSFDNFSAAGTPFLGLFNDTGDCDVVTEAAAGSGCITGTDGPFLVSELTTYLIAFGSNGGEGAFSFDLFVNVPPVNDECVDAIELFDGTPESGTTGCADQEWIYCNQVASSHQVFYHYTNGNTNNVDLDVSITGSGADPATGIEVQIHTDCGGTLFNGTNEFCDGLTPFTVECIEAGETVYFVIGSEDTEEGDFDITITENVSTVDNDECSNPSGMSVNDCEWMSYASTNADACFEDFVIGGCDFDSEAVVWFSFTAPNDAVAVEFDNLFATGTPFLGLFEDDGDCDNMTAADAGSDCITGADGPFAVIGGNDYVIAMGSTGGEGALGFDMIAITPPPNDDCTTPDNLADGVEGTTACATPWTGWTYCGIDANSHVVYYTYTNTFGSNVDLELTVSGSTATTGSSANDVEIAVITDDCNNPTFYQNMTEECNALGNLINIDCIEVGETIIVAIASLDNEEGDFSITLTETPNGVANDECVDAELIDITTPCEWETYNGDNTDACFEDFTFGGCDFNLDPVVWFTFTATADATSVEFDVITGSGTPYLAIFEDGVDCDNPTPLAGSNCVTGTDGPFDIVGGNDYLIAFGSSGGEGAFSFDMKINETPGNDDPCIGGFAPEVLFVGTITDDNTCATPDFTFCNVDNTAGKTLFYEYTMTQDADLEIIVAGITAGGPIGIGAYDTSVGCGDESNFITENCVDNTLVLPCLLAGDVIIIAIATGENVGEYGEYDITINENTPARPDNDECTDAEVITYDDADLCTWVDADNNESNINACSEDNNFGSGCDYDAEEVIWFEFTAPPATSVTPPSTINIQFLNYSGTGDLFTTVFDAGADCTNLTPISACVTGLGPHGNLANVLPNTTYLIGVGSTGDTGGNFEMQINITSGPPNDDPCADLSAYDVGGGSTLLDQTNLCAGPDGNFPECSATDQEAAVIYTFEIVDPYSGIQIIINRDPSNGTPLMGTVVVGISAIDDDFCTGTTYTPPAFCEDISNAIFDFECLEPGTYQLKLSSSEANSGDFTIEGKFQEKDTGCNESDNFDYCDDAAGNEITGLTECQPTTVAGCNLLACPETFTVGACDFTVSPTVWYSFTTLPGATTVDITNFFSQSGNGILAILGADCDNLTGVSDCIQEGGDETGIAIMENTTYYIVVGDNNGPGGDFEFDITINVPPENDDPCPTFAHPPIDLSGGGSHAGTTCCAIGFNDDPGQDYQNIDCQDPDTDDNAVWYTFTIDAGSYDGFELTVDGSIGGFTTVELYTGPADGGCTGNLTLLTSACGPLPAEIRQGLCYDDNETVYVKVGSSDEDCGDFTITVTPLTDCDVADECVDIEANQTLNPVTDPTFQTIDYVCTSGCLDLACPENPLPAGGNGCDFTSTPTVWFAIETDAIAAQLFTTVTAAGSWTPMWSVYYGDDCDNLTNAASGSTPPCSLDDDSPDLHQTGVEDLFSTYYVAVTADPNGPEIDDPNFEICAATIINVLVCLGDINDNCDPDPTVEIKITDRENAELEPDVDPEVGYMGPFCPGEEVEVHIEFFYDATESGADWMIGFVPDFGPGWNMEDYDFAADPPTGNSGAGEWHEADSDCEATMEEPVPHLCTYYDDNGVLHLCNSLCESCPDCDELGMDQGDVLPSGYFWITNGSNSGCVAGSCRPGQQWGIGSTTSQINWDFTLTVKDFASEEECLENNDLQLTFQTFSDGGAGCWEDPLGECLIDRKQLGPNWLVECDEPPAVIASPQPRDICTEGVVDINVITEDGSDLEIEVIVVDNPNVEGENDHVFTGGFGNIDDVLTLSNDNCTPEEVTYYAKAIDPTVKCLGREDTILVTVYPKPEIEQDDIPGECYPSLSQYSFEDYLICEGYPGELSWDWQETNTGAFGNTSTIQFDESFEPGTYTYSVTVTDELGCNTVDEVSFEIWPPVHFTMNDTTVCYDSEVFYICPEFDQEGTPDYEYVWTWDCFPAGDNASCFYIDPVTTVFDCPDETEFELNLLVFDANYCTFDTTITVTINPGPSFNLDPANPSFCAGQNEVEVCLTDVFGNVDYVVYDQPDGEEIYAYVPPFYCVTLTQLGDHTVTVYDFNGCERSLDFYVGENTIEEPVIEGDTIICVGDSTVLTVTGDYETYSWSTGEETQSITVIPDVTTSYTVNVTDQNMCSASNEVTVTVLSTELPALPDTASFCAGGYTIINAGAGFDEYHWYQGSISGTEVGTQDSLVVSVEDWYFIEVFLEGCPAVDSIFVESGSELSPSVYGDFTLCFEQDSTLVIATGGAFIQYIWTDTIADPNMVVDQGSSLDSIYLGEGTYELYVEDAFGCFGTIVFDIIKQAPVVVDIFPSVDTIDICFGTDTMLYATPGFVSYEWELNDTPLSFNDTIFNAEKGSYMVTVTNADGCIGVDSIYVREFPAVLPNLGPDQDICATDIAILTPGTGYAAYTWWFNGVENPTWANEDSLFVNDGGEYVVEVEDAIGCFERDTVIVNKTDELMPAIINNADICDGDTITLFVQQTFDNYSWTNSFGTVLSTGDSLNVNLAGDYFLAVSSNTGCFGYDTVTVVVHTPPVANVDNDVKEACGADSSNGATTLDFTQYINSTDPGDWTDTDGSGVITNGDWSSVDFSNVLPGTYTFTFTTNNAIAPCVNDFDILTVFVEECDCDLFYIDPIDDQCNEGFAVIDLSSLLTTEPTGLALFGTWTIVSGPGGTPLSGDQFDPAAALEGIYTLQFTLNAIGNWCYDTQTVDVLVSDAKAADVDDDTKDACGFDSSNGSSILDFTSYLNSTDAGTWVDTDGSGVITNGDWSSVDFSNVMPGTYTYTFTTTGANAPCQNVFDVLTVVVAECDCDLFTITALDDLCNEGSGTVDLNTLLVSDPTGLIFDGTWVVTTGPGGSPLNGSIFDPTLAVGGTYTLTFTHNVQGNWCDASQSFDILVIRAEQIGVIADSPETCLGTELLVELESLIEGEDTGGIWTELSSSTGSAFDAVNGTFNTLDQAVGVYTFEYTLNATTPCVDKSIVVEVTINPLPTADAGEPKFACFGDVVLVGGSSSQGTDFTYEWKNVDGTIVSTDRTFEISQSGTYTLVVTNIVTGCIDQDQMDVTIFPNYAGSISGKDLLIDGETETLRLTLTDLDLSQIGSFVWYKDGELIPGAGADTLFIEESGEYCVDIIPDGIDASACVVTVCKIVNTVLTKEVYIPNVFSPNGDGDNDLFTVEGGKNVQVINNISVFDRWGELVFQSGSFTLDKKYEFGWDGQFKGQRAMQGVYVYVVEVLYFDDTRETVSGDITLIR